MNHPKIVTLIQWSQSYSLPGFEGVPLFTVSSFLYKELSNDRIMTRANSIAFNLMLAIFPAIIFLLTLFAYLPLSDNYGEILLTYFKEFLPHTAHDVLTQIYTSILERRQGGLLSIGFVLAFVFASNGMLSFMTAFSKKQSKDIFKRRTIIKQRAIALLLTISLGLLFSLSLVLVVLSGRIFEWLDIANSLPVFTQYLILIGKWIVTFSLIYIGVTILYRYGPKFRRRIPFINPGAIMVTVVSILSSIGFSYIVNRFGRYNTLYGSFGALIVMMIWLQINAFIILAGFELNASIRLSQKLKLPKSNLRKANRTK